VDELSATLSIDTPENILLDAEIAGFGTRCMAALIDYTLLIIILIALDYLFFRTITKPELSSGGLAAFVVLLQFVVVTFYHLILEFFWNGQTPGKRLIGIRVVQANGLPLTASGAVIRNLVRLVDFLPIFYGVGMVMMFATKHSQRLGDLAARTVVIREQRRLTISSVKKSVSVRYLYVKAIDPLPPYIKIDNLSATDHQTVLNYLSRRFSLRDRGQIAMLVARPIAEKIGEPTAVREISISVERTERYLEYIARAFEIRSPPAE